MTMRRVVKRGARVVMQHRAVHPRQGQGEGSHRPNEAGRTAREEGQLSVEVACGMAVLQAVGASEVEQMSTGRAIW
jgi:hypothetical protein